MKLGKITLIVLVTAIIITSLFSEGFSTYASSDIRLIINNTEVVCDVAPVIVNDRTLVPVRALFEHLDAEVSWNDTLRQVVVTSEQSVMVLTVDSSMVWLNSEIIYLDSAPIIINDRTLVPVRFISENLGYNVEWDDLTRTVLISSGTLSDAEDAVQQNFAASMTSVSADDDADSIKINVELTSIVEPKVSTLSSPDRLIFDFGNVYLQCPDGKHRPENSYPVNEIRWARHSDYARIVVESEEVVTYSYEYVSADKCVITVNKSFSNTGADTDEEFDANVSADINVNITGDVPTVVIDAGHGGRDSGAVGRDDDGNIILYEKKVCLDISQRVRNLLIAAGINVIMTRSSDIALGDTTMDDLLARCKIANESDACLFVSIHNNAFTNPNASGTCVLYAGLSTNSDYGITGKQLAQNILTPLVEATGLQDRGLVESPNIVVLKRTAMPAALVECAFITCKRDQAVLSDDAKLDDIAGAIYSGIVTSLKQMGRIN